MKSLKTGLHLVFIFVLSCSYGYSQDSLKTIPSNDSLSLFAADTLGLRLSYPVERQLPKDLINIRTPKSPLEVDTRTGSYYTPKIVQDKLDDIMNRPRSDSFVPLLGLAAFAVNVAVKQLEAAKLFEPKAEDYMLSDKELLVLEQLWIKAPQKIDELYLNTSLQEGNTANELQKTISKLTDINLVKTRTDGKKMVLFFPSQKLDHVKNIIRNAVNDTKRLEKETDQLKLVLNRFENIEQQKDKIEKNDN